jgi:tetratricopeptide (TPR) repeat protein
MTDNQPGIGDYIYFNRAKFRIKHLDGYEIVDGKLSAINLWLTTDLIGTKFEYLPVDSFQTMDEYTQFFNSLISSKTFEKGLRLLETHFAFLGPELSKKLHGHATGKKEEGDWEKAVFAMRWAVELWKIGDEKKYNFLAHTTWDLGRLYEELGQLNLEQKNNTQADQNFLRAIETYEVSQDAFYRIGKAHDVHQIQWFIANNYRKLGQYDTALEKLNEIESYFTTQGNAKELEWLFREKVKNYAALRLFEREKETVKKQYDLARKNRWGDEAVGHLFHMIRLSIQQGKLIIAENDLETLNSLPNLKDHQTMDAKWYRMILAKKQFQSELFEQLYAEIEQRFKEQNDMDQLAKLFKTKASYFEDAGKYQDALDFYRKTESIFVEKKMFAPLGWLLMEMGILYKNINRFSDSLDFHRRAWDIFIAHDLKEGINQCRKNLEVTVSKAAHQNHDATFDQRLNEYFSLIDQQKIDELIHRIESGIDIWRKNESH